MDQGAAERNIRFAGWRFCALLCKSPEGGAFGAAPPGPTLLGVALPHLKKGRELPGLCWR